VVSPDQIIYMLRAVHFDVNPVINRVLASGRSHRCRRNSIVSRVTRLYDTLGLFLLHFLCAICQCIDPRLCKLTSWRFVREQDVQLSKRPSLSLSYHIVSPSGFIPWRHALTKPKPDPNTKQGISACPKEGCFGTPVPRQWTQLSKRYDVDESHVNGIVHISCQDDGFRSQACRRDF